MVLTKNELVASLQNEVRILLHLAGKVDRAKLDYRPTPKQRSTLELLQYLSMMGLCGREELSTMNLWAGMDRQPAG